jgi:murein DD-endopeptidase MepM/ murein hydrolase activator NlpD
MKNFTAEKSRMIMNRNMAILILLISYTFLLNSCASTSSANFKNEPCENYIDNNKSFYVLPFLPGEKHKLIQGNCEKNENPWTHFGSMRYAYDFEMPIGTTIIAARKGTVIFVRDEFTDNDHGKDQGNAIVIVHEDGTIALYGHMTYKGSKVKVGQIVQQGEAIALSGNSGESPFPHLHFQVNECGDFEKCETLPITFSNVYPSVTRLEKNCEYEAK